MFAHVEDARGAQAWLGGLLGQVTSAELWTGPKPETTLNVALTCAGPTCARRLRERRWHLLEGVSRRHGRTREVLGDTGERAPAHWEHPFGTGSAHVLVTINALTAELLEGKLDVLRAGVHQADGVSIVYEQHAHLLVGVREHFGYADGLAQPAIAGVTPDRAPGGGVPEKEDTWRALALGEFILGYDDEDSLVDPLHRLPSAPAEPLGRSGTYMIYRKLSQDVALFRKTLHEAACLYGDGDEEKLAAKVAGRWRQWDAASRLTRCARSGASTRRIPRQRLSLSGRGMPTAPGVRSARTSVAPTHATRSAGRGSRTQAC